MRIICKKNSLIILLFVFSIIANAQPIGGIINSYAKVNSIVGTNINVTTTAGFTVGGKIMIIQMQGATINTANAVTFGNITAMNNAGVYELRVITAIAGLNITVASAPVSPFNTTTGAVQIVTVPDYCQPVVTTTLTAQAWNGNTGGVLAFEAGTLTLNSDINVSGLGFRGGNFATSNFCCSNGGYAGAFNVNGGQKGESIAAWIAGLDGMKGKQANGGGSGNCGNSGGGGGANFSAGGLGGNQYSGCGGFDERGIGGLGLTQTANTLFMGGGGGGGFRDNGQVATAGGNGGGIIAFKANEIICNNRVIASNGASVTAIANDEGSGGGGAGGTVNIKCTTYTGNLTIRTNGGNGGSNNNAIFTGDCHGTGGGGSGGSYIINQASIPVNVTYNTNGGAAGLVLNPASTCFNTTFGASAGTNGGILANVPYITPPAFNTPTLSVTGNFSVCTGQSTTLTANGATTYTWNPGAFTVTNNIVTPAANTTYTLIGANGSCTASITQTVIVSPSPTLSVTGNTNICSGTSATLTASGAQTYTWNTGAQTNSINVNPLVNSIYTVSAQSLTAPCIATQTIAVNVTLTPVVNVLGTPTICIGQTTTTLTASGATNYIWTPNSGLNTASGNSVVANPTASVVYTVIGANGICTDTSAISITAYTVPIANVVSTASICSGGLASLSVSGATSYSWSTGSLSPTIIASPSVTTNYTVTAFENGCNSQSVVTVSVVTTPTVSIAGTNTLCAGQASVALTASGAPNYLWSPAGSLSASTGANVLAFPASTTQYSVLGANGTCTNQAVYTVSVFTVPIITSAASQTFLCSGNTSNISANGANSYAWTFSPFITVGNSALVSVSPQSTAFYTVTGISNGCSGVSTGSILVVASPQLQTGVTRPVICQFANTTLNASGANSYNWQPGNSLSSATAAVVIATPTVPTVYTVVATNGVAPNICSRTQTLSINVIPNASVQVVAPDSICFGQKVTLNASGGTTYSWSPVATISSNTEPDFIINPTVTTVYTVTAKNGSLCPSTKVFTVNVNPLPIVSAGRDTSINFDEWLYLKGTSNDGIFYTWSTTRDTSLGCINCIQTFANPQQTTCYILEVINVHGCRASDEVCVEVRKEYEVYMPNAFTPNSDGLNEIFRPKGASIKEYRLSIFNRWGQLMYDGKGGFKAGTEGNGWDGTYKGKPCEEGVYVYKLEFLTPASKNIVKTGHVMLLNPQN